MNQPQEIIVYRNPGEKLMWDFFMNGQGAIIWPVFFYLFLAFFAFIIAYSLYAVFRTHYLLWKGRNRRW